MADGILAYVHQEDLSISQNEFKIIHFRCFLPGMSTRCLIRLYFSNLTAFNFVISDAYNSNGCGGEAAVHNEGRQSQVVANV